MIDKEALGLIVDIEARTAKLEAGLKKASATQSRAAKAMEDRAQQSARKIEASYQQATGGISGAFDRLGATFNRNRWQVQNFSYQLADVAVQLEQGTKASRVFARQGSQMLAAFGPLGAVAGAAAATLIPLGALLLSSSEKAQSLDQAMDRVKTSTDAYAKAAAEASRPISELRAEFGDMADEMQRVNDLNLQLTKATAAIATKDLGKKLAEEAGGLSRTKKVLPDAGLLGKLGMTASPEMYATAKISEFERGVARLKDKYQIAEGAARKLAEAIERLGDTTGAREQAEALRDMMEALSEGGMRDFKEKVQQALETTRGTAEFRKAFAGIAEEYIGGMENLSEAAAAFFADLVERHGEAMSRVATDQERTAQKLIQTYDADTQRLIALTEQRGQAEKLLDQARKDGNAEQIAQFQRVIAAIDSQIAKTRELARETDAAFQAMSKNLRDYAGSMLSSGFTRVFGISPEQFGRDATAAERGILDLIASKESGKDGYNATLDHGRWTGGPRDLVNMTLNEILALGDRMRTPENRALYGDGKGSSALGRYQIVGQTLRGLMESLGLKGDELYDSAMQDRLALELVRQRRPQSVDGMRAEWAGLKSVPPAIIQSALGNQEVPAVDPEVARRSAQAASEAQRQLEKEIDQRKRAAETAKDFSAALDATLANYALEAELAGKTASQIAKARVEHQLYAQAQRQGIELTTEMQAKIAQVGDAAAAAAVEAPAFTSFLKDGLKDAVLNASTLEEGLFGVADAIRKAALEAALFGEGPMAALFGTAGGGGLFGIAAGGLASVFGGRGMVAGNDVMSQALKGAIGFSSGGYTGDGPRDRVAGLVHAGEYVLSKPAVQRIGVGNLQALHRGALQGYAKGGLVGDTRRAARALSGPHRASATVPTISIQGGPITVNATGGSPQQNADLASKIGAETEKALRGLVTTELLRQKQPGGLLR